MYQLKSASELHVSERYGDNYLGCTVLKDKTVFRVFCPRSPQVEVEIFDTFEAEQGQRVPMKKLESGVWELTSNQNLSGKYYGYRVKSPKDGLPFEDSDFPIADPYSKWCTVKNNYSQEAKTLIFEPEPFNWENDSFSGPSDPRDLVIYEAHLKDLVCHNSPFEEDQSLYERFLHAGGKGGIQYLKQLNINAIEFLPLQKFAYVEPPYNETTPEGVTNTWNPYSLNYWGYMTSFFFMPESLYAEKSFPKPGDVYGKQPTAINQLKQLVKSLHKAGIAVIIDVVYNHVSQYDRNPLKYLDRSYYFRHDAEKRYTSYSGCGNDLKTDSPMARKLVIDSVLYWIKEFHIDGFRFDLANIIDRETLIRIREEARKVNPNVILIAEPWGAGYNPTGFSEIGWPSWNDQIRNGIKGSDPVHDPGIIFGVWQRESSRLSVENYVRGTLLNQPNGRFKKSLHSLNYLESHDGYTLADFIRIVYNKSLAHTPVPSKEEITKLSGPELNSAKLAAFILMISQGIAMIHAGQEFGRAKMIVKNDVDDPEKGRLDHNSYNKDNETNYLDFDDIGRNQELFDYYKGLIKLRSNSPALRKASPESIRFTNYEDPLLFTLFIKNHGTKDPFEYLICFNTNPFREHTLTLPEGFWQLMVSETVASDVPISVINGIVKTGPLSAVLLRKLSGDH